MLVLNITLQYPYITNAMNMMTPYVLKRELIINLFSPTQLCCYLQLDQQ